MHFCCTHLGQYENYFTPPRLNNFLWKQDGVDTSRLPELTTVEGWGQNHFAFLQTNDEVGL